MKLNFSSYEIFFLYRLCNSLVIIYSECALWLIQRLNRSCLLLTILYLVKMLLAQNINQKNINFWQFLIKIAQTTTMLYCAVSDARKKCICSLFNRPLQNFLQQCWNKQKCTKNASRLKIMRTPNYKKITKQLTESKSKYTEGIIF